MKLFVDGKELPLPVIPKLDPGGGFAADGRLRSFPEVEFKYDPDTGSTTATMLERLVTAIVKQRDDAVVEEITKHIMLQPGEYLTVVQITEDEVREIVREGLAALISKGRRLGDQ